MRKWVRVVGVVDKIGRGRMYTCSGALDKSELNWFDSCARSQHSAPNVRFAIHVLLRERLGCALGSDYRPPYRWQIIDALLCSYELRFDSSGAASIRLRIGDA